MIVIFLTLLVIALDQYTKLIILKHISPGEVIEVISGFFNLTLVYNRGAAFGLMADLDPSIRRFVLGAATLFALGAVLYFFIYDYARDKIARWAMALIIGGAIGNVIDRIRFGEVVDFLDFYIGTTHWPAFNVADSAICVGVCVLLLRSSLSPKDVDKKLGS